MGLKHGGAVVRLKKANLFNPRTDAGEPVSVSEFSSSGVLLDTQHGLVLTSGQVFAGVIKGQARRNHIPAALRRWGISAKQTDAYFTERDMMSGVSIDVVLPHGGVASPASLPSASKTSEDIPMNHSTDSCTSTKQARLLLLWKCQDFEDVLRTIVPDRDGWKLTEEAEEDEVTAGQSGQGSEPVRDGQTGQCVEPFGLSSVSRNLPQETFISWFALLQLTELADDSRHVQPFSFMRPSAFVDGLTVKQGDLVCLQATPFGATCPTVFLNSISKGVISNVAGSRHQLIMTDARCIPGSEGGGLYLPPAESESGNHSHLAGIIVSPLCWKNNEWIGLTLACSMQVIVQSLSAFIPFVETASPDKALAHPLESLQAPSSVVERCMRSAALIRVGPVWGSGVVVDAINGIVVTCRHVIQKATDYHVRVRLDYPSKHWQDATVLYRTSPTSPFDLAILKLGGGVDQAMLASHSPGKRRADSVNEGQPVFIVGHALLAPELDLPPSVSAGVVSKVIHANSIPVMLQSTCAVHSGISGGALFCRRTGSILGIITSNARDVDSKVSFPHINFSVPWDIIGPVLNDYLQTDDVTKLEALDKHSDCLGPLWSLDEERITQRQCKVIASKL